MACKQKLKPEVISESDGQNWKMYLGDSCEVIKGLPDNSIDFGIHSPPFSNLYIYSDSEADMGNSASDAEFIEHYEYLIAEMLRVTVSGRLCVVHCKDLPKYANRDGTAGLKDFPGSIIAAYERQGWSYHSRITVWKCPVIERERTNNNGLLHKTVLRDRSQLRQGMADYLVVFRKPPEGELMSDKPVCKTTVHVNEERDEITTQHGFEYYVGDNNFHPGKSDTHPSRFARGRGRKAVGEHEHVSSINIWRRYAEPVWWDIDQMDVLNYRNARSDKDERHICPLQLGLIERCIQIWSLEGEIVFSPFAGIGSEGVSAIRQGRKFVGIELKDAYFQQATANLQSAEKCNRESTMLLPGFNDEEETHDVRKGAEFGALVGPVAEVHDVKAIQ